MGAPKALHVLPRRRPFGVNVIGYVTGNLGLGVATRQTISMLKQAGVPVAATDIDPGLGRGAHDLSHQLRHAARLQRTPYSLTLFHMNPGELAHYLRTQPELTRFDRITAIVPFWELEVLPEDWISVLEAMDVILTPTTFIRAAIEKVLPDAICVDYPQIVTGLDDPGPDRSRWGMRPDSTVFVTSFDLSSAIERKNPNAVVAAFQEAFAGRDDVQLILKANGVGLAEDRSGRWRDLVEIASADPRMQVLTEVLPYHDVISLYASADCLVSLHRSEGLGLSMMEAMMLGKPTIATNWSGNLDFMSPQNSLLVDCDLVPVVSEHPSYAGYGERGAVWAEPSVSSAAQHMREVANNPRAAHALGRRAQQDLLERQARLRSGGVLDELRATLHPQSVVWQAHHERRDRLRRLARGAEMAALARQARRLPRPVRALGRPAANRLRGLLAPSSAPSASRDRPPPAAPPPGPVDLNRFFAEFSDEFRGTEQIIAERLQVYVPHLKALHPVREGAAVLDIGCGRGELLRVLADAGVSAIGVDTNAEAVARAVAAGMDAVVADGLSHLKAQPEGCLGAVTGIHIVEHLTLEQRLAIFAECYRVLAPGGAVVFETPNPQSVQVGAYTFWLDPSHLQPVPPQLLDFSLRFTGFQTETLFLQALRPDAKPRGRYLRELYSSVYGFADFAVIGHKPL